MIHELLLVMIREKAEGLAHVVSHFVFVPDAAVVATNHAAIVESNSRGAGEEYDVDSNMINA